MLSQVAGSSPDWEVWEPVAAPSNKLTVCTSWFSYVLLGTLVLLMYIYIYIYIYVYK
jgi:hypothetical protein